MPPDYFSQYMTPGNPFTAQGGMPGTGLAPQPPAGTQFKTPFIPYGQYSQPGYLPGGGQQPTIQPGLAAGEPAQWLPPGVAGSPFDPPEAPADEAQIQDAAYANAMMRLQQAFPMGIPDQFVNALSTPEGTAEADWRAQMQSAIGGQSTPAVLNMMHNQYGGDAAAPSIFSRYDNTNQGNMG